MSQQPKNRKKLHYTDFSGPAFRALRYPFTSHKRDFCPRVFNMDETVDGEKIFFTAEAILNTVSLTPSRSLPVKDLLPRDDRVRRSEATPGTEILLYDVQCETPYGVYQAHDMVPILAIGSNSSDEQLSRKLRIFDEACDVFIMPAWQKGWGVTFMPAMVEYGSFAANYAPLPAIESRVTVGFYRLETARHIILSEDTYDICRIKQPLMLDNGDVFEGALVFMADHGHISLDGGERPALMKEVTHRGADLPHYHQVSQYEMQCDIAEKHFSDKSLTEFVDLNIKDDAFREKMSGEVERLYGMRLSYDKKTDLILKGENIKSGKKILQY